MKHLRALPFGSSPLQYFPTKKFLPCAVFYGIRGNFDTTIAVIEWGNSSATTSSQDDSDLIMESLGTNLAFVPDFVAFGGAV